MRKQPSQARSKAMVERILDAAGRALVAGDIEDMTTRRVAELADISIGSLYQYFEDKQSLLAALQDRMAEDIVAMATGLAPRMHEADLPEAIRMLLNRLCEMLDADDGTYLALIRQWNRTDFSDNLKRLEATIYELVGMRAALRGSADEPTPTPRVIYIALNAAVLSLIRYLSEPSPYFSRDELIEGLVITITAAADAEAQRMQAG